MKPSCLVEQAGKGIVVKYQEFVGIETPCTDCNILDDNVSCLECRERDGDHGRPIYEEKEERFDDLQSALNFIAPKKVVVSVSGIDPEVVSNYLRLISAPEIKVLEHQKG